MRIEGEKFRNSLSSLEITPFPGFIHACMLYKVCCLLRFQETDVAPVFFGFEIDKSKQ